MKFNQIATKAALMTINKMRDEMEQNLNFAIRMEESADSKDDTQQGNNVREQELVFAASAMMEAELLKNNIEELELQIGTQIFNY